MNNQLAQYDVSETIYKVTLSPSWKTDISVAVATASSESYIGTPNDWATGIHDMIATSSQIEKVGIMPRLHLAGTIKADNQAMTVEERLALILATAGAWVDMEEDPTDEPWGWIDWGDLEDGSDISA